MTGDVNLRTLGENEGIPEVPAIELIELLGSCSVAAGKVAEGDLFSHEDGGDFLGHVDFVGPGVLNRGGDFRLRGR